MEMIVDFSCHMLLFYFTFFPKLISGNCVKLNELAYIAL